MTGQIYACFELKSSSPLWNVANSPLTHQCFSQPDWDEVSFYKQLISSSNKKVPWQTLQQRWMEDFIFQLSLGDFSQVSLSNYLLEFHIDYWTMAELQSLHLSPLSSLHRLDCYVFPSFLPLSVPLGFDLHVYGVQSFCWQSPVTFMVEGCSACSHF